MIRLRQLLILFTLGGALAFGQAPVNYTGIITGQIDQMTTNFAPLFLAEANTVFNAISVVMLIVLGLRIARASLRAHAFVFPLDELIHFAFLWCFCAFLLRYWNAPTPVLAGNSVHGVIPAIAYDLAGKINIAALNTMTAAVDQILTNTPLPNAWRFLEIALYFEFTGLMLLAEAILFCLTLLGFVAIGLGTLIGPLTVPFILIPRFDWLFYNWVSFTIKYSFYQVLANGLTFIWANAFNFVISNVFNNQFTLANAAREILGLGLLTAGMIASIWYVTHWAGDLFTGSSHAGNSLSGAVRGVVTKALTKGAAK
jgi:hypothetical protein